MIMSRCHVANKIYTSIADGGGTPNSTISPSFPVLSVYLFPFFCVCPLSLLCGDVSLCCCREEVLRKLYTVGF